MNHISDRTAQWPYISESQNQCVQTITQMFGFGRCKTSAVTPLCCSYLLQEKKLKQFHPCWFVVLSRKPKNISGQTAVLLLVVSTKQKNQAGSPLFVLVFKIKT